MLIPSYIETHPAPIQTAVGTDAAQNFFIWGDALLESTNVPEGTYRDTVTITVAWP